MRFTKDICEEAIFLEPGDVPIHSTGEVFNTYPCVFNTLTFQLMATDLLVSLSDSVSGKEDSLYSFYISVNEYCRIDNCIVVWDADEELLIELEEEERNNLYERLDGLCREMYRKGCEEMLKS